jgi:hypothetical protein
VLVEESRIKLADLTAYFESRPERVFSQSDLFSIFSSYRLDWNLPRKMNEASFIEMLRRRTKMSEIGLTSRYRPLLRYVWGTKVSLISIALSIKRGAFCSRGTAMWIHGLGGDEHHIYVNREQSEKPRNSGVLMQDAIDRAFRNEQRRTKLIYQHLDATIVVLNGKNSGRLEVESAKTPSGEHVEVTSLERTLVDITVRPAYAGGISSVLASFRLARGRVSVIKLLQILKALDYTYPFHQSIGFYLKRSEYTKDDQDLVRELGTRFNFYLGHGIKDPAFDEEFRVFFPKSF